MKKRRRGDALGNDKLFELLEQGAQIHSGVSRDCRRLEILHRMFAGDSKRGKMREMFRLDLAACLSNVRLELVSALVDRMRENGNVRMVVPRLSSRGERER